MNIANKLTISRICLIPVFITAALTNGVAAAWVAFAVFVIASITDYVDGRIARKYNMISAFGKFLDPLADKLLVTAALCVFVGNGLVSVWVLFIITVREFVVTGIRLVAAADGTVIAASMWGKIKTVLQLVVISLMLLPVDTGIYAELIGTLSIADILIYAVCLVTVFSGIDYLVKNVSVLKSSK
ncbi:MAG: CDP-diacylglycerol--glycerol-3-phosphate 3-phosphatidyltransferase [Clostridia bacterium]|nr:CDP-diacylglycerol--glycerol-3-phosphate 3-phosphatidyltransferase [Clostridia bacterium]